MINKFGLLGAKKNRAIAIVLILVLLCGLCGSMVLSIFQHNTDKSEPFVPMQSKTSENIEMLRDLPQDFTFDINADDNIDQENLADYVTVNDSRNMPVDVRVERHMNYYTILPPQSMYEQGEYYTVQLQNAKFQDKRLSMQNKVTFATGKDDVMDVDVKTELSSVAVERVVYSSDDTIELVKESGKEYNVGDILLLPDTEEGVGEVAYKIVNINADNGSIISLEVVRPSLDEVYDKVEIYGAQLPNPDDVSFYSEESIEEALANNESVKAMGYAVDVLNGNLAWPAAKGWSVDGDIDITINLPKKIKIKIKDVKFDPVQFTVDMSIKWELTKLDTEIFLEGQIKSRAENFSNMDSKTNLYSSGTKTINEYSFGIRIEFTKNSDFSEIQKYQMLEYFNKHKQIQNPLNPDKWYDPAWAIQSLDHLNSEKYKKENKKYKDLLDGKDKTAIHEPATINNFIRGKSSGSSNIGSYIKGTEEARKEVKKALNNLVNCYQAGKTDDTTENKNKLGSSRMDSQLLPIVNIPIAGPCGFSVHFRFGFELALDLTAVFEGKLKVKQTNEQVNVTTENGSENYENSTTVIAVALTLSGAVDVRVGLAFETKFSLLKILYVSFKLEAGEYVEAKGLGGVVFGDTEIADMFATADTDGEQIGGVKKIFEHGALVGHLAFDMGPYIKAEVKAGLVLDLKIIKIDISAAISYEKKWSIFNEEEKETETVTGVADPETYSELIFEDQLKGRFKDEIAAGEVFKDDMEFNEEFIEFYGDNSDAAITMNYDEYFAKVPRVLRRTIDLTTREVTYEPIPFNRLHYDQDEGTRIDAAGTIRQYDMFNPVIDDLVWITAEDRYGESYSMDEFAFLQITKEAVPVDKIEISVQSSNIYSDSETYIFADIIPEYASYKTLRYDVVGIIHQGERVPNEEFANYAYFDDSFNSTRGKLITTDKLSIGDQVIVRCTALHDNVDSAPLTLTVVRRPVENIALITQNRQTTVVVGQELPIEVLVYPLNATYVIEGGIPTITTYDPDLATIIEKDGKLILKVTDNPSAFGHAVGINIQVNDNGNIVELNYAMMIIQVPIDRLMITNENSIELDSRTILNQGQEISLVAVAEPLDATVLNRIQILKSVSNEYVTIDEQSGKLKVADNAPIGYAFTVSARYDNINSKNYHFEVEKIKTESVTLTEKNENYNVAPNHQRLLKVAVEPENATYFAPTYTIEPDCKKYADVSYTGLVTIKEDAPIGAKIRIYATVDGVVSNTVEFKIPATKVEVISPKNVLKVGESVALGCDLAPTDKTLSKPLYRIAKGEEYATLSLDNVLTINSDVLVPDAVVGIEAEVEGLCSPIYYISIKVPVTSVELYTTMSSGNVELGGSILLHTAIYPEYATCTDIEFSIGNENLATLKDGRLTVTDDKNAIDSIVEITATVDGVVSNILQIRIIKVSVLAVEFAEETLECGVDIGASKELRASTLPSNATNNQVSYRIVSGMDCGNIDGDMLTINNNAQLGSRIEIIASADGVDSDEALIVIVKKVDVQKVDIAVENNIDSIAPEGIAQFSAVVYPNNATESIITYSIVGEGRNIAVIDAVSGILTVCPAQLITRGDMVIQVIATADGVSSNPVCLHVNVPINDITMLNREIIAKRGDVVQLSSDVNYNATYKDVEYHFWDGSNISDKNQYGTIDGNTLHISKNILIPNAELMIVAIPHGAESMDVMSDACVVRVNIPVESVSLTSNKTTIIIGESATLSTSIFPVFASDRTIKYQFVDNLGNITSKPWGITFDGDMITVADDLALLTSTPRFMVCAFVGGVVSNVWRFDVIERVVTELTFDMDALQKIYCFDTQTYEVHPNFKYEDLIKASVNSDASYKGITFSAITGSTDIDNIDCAESQRFDGLSYYVTLKVIKHAAVGDVITILAQSQRNPQIRAELKLTITGIYADEIVGANISATDSRGANCITILDGEEFAGALNGYTSNYINPGDTVRINNLYFDDEIVNKYHKKVTYDDNYSVVYSDQRFISVTEKGFAVLPLDKILEYLKPLDDHFTATVIFKQANGRTLTKDFTFYIFVGVRTVQYIDGIDANGTAFEMTDCQKLYVDRNHGTDKNSFTFRFKINNGTFTTNRLLLVNNITEADILDNKFEDTLSATSNDFLNGKSLPQITFEEDRANRCNVVNIKFEAWYNVGTVFKVVLLNPDHAADRAPLFSFSLHIKPVNESSEVGFGSDGIYKAGVGITDPGGSAIKKSYQVKYQEGPMVINEVSEYADLRVGYAVQLRLGDQRNDLGQVWQFNEEESYHIGIDFPEDSPWGDFIIRADTDAKDSVYTGKLAKLVFDYSDGVQELRSVVYIRIVKPLELQSKSSLRGDNKDNHPRDLVWDMEEGIVFGESGDRRSTYLEPDYKLYRTDKGNLSASLKDDGKTLVVTDPNVFEICKIKYNYKQFYNGVEIKVEDEETHELERRFIANKEQLLNMKNDFTSNACGEVRLIADIDLSDKSNVDLGELVVDFNGNGHTISNIKYSIGSQKLKHAEYHGLFNKIMQTAGVRNLNLRNVTATSGKRHNGSFYYFGALAYENFGTIDNVSVWGESKINIERQASSVGGIVSINKGTIRNSDNEASIKGSGDIGGIAGRNEGTIEGCWNGGDIAIVYESSRSIGGIVGYNHGEGNVIKCNNGGHISSVNTIKGHINVGAIIGHNAANFDGTGWVGSFYVTYTRYDGFIFGWGAYDNGTYLFAYYGYRVGRNK